VPELAGAYLSLLARPPWAVATLPTNLVDDLHGLLRFARTAAGISPEQLAFQILRRVQGAARPRRVPVVEASEPFWQRLGDRLRECPPPPEWDGAAVADAALRGEWDLLGERIPVDAQRDWSRRVGRPLHSFHLQYHEPLRALARRADRDGDTDAVAQIAAVVGRWIETTQAGGGDAWHPYPISVRVFVWFEVLALVGARLERTVRARMLASLASQLDVLARRRERQIGANHLQRNDAALALGGLGFIGAPAERWRTVGLTGTWAALQQHVLADGMHYERSPMYHAGMLADVLRVMECCDVAGAPVPAEARTRVASMAHALRCLTRPDGSLHQFNDTAAGIAPPTDWLLQRAAAATGRALAPADAGAWTLAASGYAGWRDPALGTSVVMDAGAAGPREQPGHAQCDALSIELSLGGQPVLVNAGVHGYDQDPYREYSRSTRGHNTVQIGSQEQHEIWATFRVARFGTVDGPVVHAADPWTVSGRVRGYAGGAHHRRLERVPSGALRITDTIEGDAGSTAVARLLFAPAFVLTREADAVVARAADLVVRVTTTPVVQLRLTVADASGPEGWYFPTFGVAERSTCVAIEVPLPSPPVETTISWETA
jgi:uncharacterized heparinase superfamily protein